MKMNVNQIFDVITKTNDSRLVNFKNKVYYKDDFASYASYIKEKFPDIKKSLVEKENLINDLKEVFIESYDGEKIPALLLEQSKNKQWAIIAYDYRETWMDSFFRGLQLFALGYSLLLIETRGSGKLNSLTCTFGDIEQIDITVATDYLTAYYHPDAIGLMGAGLGAYIICRAIDNFADVLVSNQVRWFISENAPSNSSIFFNPLIRANSANDEEFFNLQKQLGNLFFEKTGSYVINEPAFLQKNSSIPTLFLASLTDNQVYYKEGNYLMNQKAGVKDKYLTFPTNNYTEFFLENYSNLVRLFISFFESIFNVAS